MTVVVSEVVTPSTLDSPTGDEFLAWADFINDGWAWLQGNRTAVEDPNLMWQVRRGKSYSTRIDKVARLDGVIAGSGMLTFDNGTSNTAEIEVLVHNDEHWETVGVALMDDLIAVATSLGRTSILAWSAHRPAPQENSIPSPTGFGWLSQTGQTTFLKRYGYKLEQVERHSAFDLTRDLSFLDQVERDAMVKAGDDYRVVWWSGATPDEYIDGYATAVGRMSTDIPSGELATEATTWDADRIRDRDTKISDAGGIMARAAVIHEPTGVVAAFNELQIGAHRTLPTTQWGTLVLPEHRSKRLGSVVKARGLREWAKLVPTSPLVHTWNAEENRPMLSVNEAVGFVALDYVGAWQLTIE